MVYLFDGTYNGFLTCVFEAFERKELDATLSVECSYEGSLFEDCRVIEAETQKSLRVKKGLIRKSSKAFEFQCYTVFLAESIECANMLFRMIVQLFLKGELFLQNFGNSDVLLFHQTLRKVGRERHRMQAFIRFQKTSDGMFFSIIEPDFNVLPLLVDFFRNRYTDQSWLIYDVKRKYGLLYNQNTVEEVTLSEDEILEQTHDSIVLEDRELYFQNLWKQYFKSTNIVERKNLKLHLKCVPKRYWKYLIEKQT